MKSAVIVLHPHVPISHMQEMLSNLKTRGYQVLPQPHARFHIAVPEERRKQPRVDMCWWPK